MGKYILGELTFSKDGLLRSTVLTTTWIKIEIKPIKSYSSVKWLIFFMINTYPLFWYELGLRWAFKRVLHMLGVLHKSQFSKLGTSSKENYWSLQEYLSLIKVCFLELFISDLRRQELLHTINVHWCLWRHPDFSWCFIVFIFLPEQM